MKRSLEAGKASCQFSISGKYTPGPKMLSIAVHRDFSFVVFATRKHASSAGRLARAYSSKEPRSSRLLKTLFSTLCSAQRLSARSSGSRSRMISFACGSTLWMALGQHGQAKSVAEKSPVILPLLAGTRVKRSRYVSLCSIEQLNLPRLLEKCISSFCVCDMTCGWVRR